MMFTLAVFLAAAILPQEQDWPREYAGEDGGKLVLYQPQVETWEAQSRIHARLALAYSAEESSPPVFGAFELGFDTEVDLENREVRVSNFEVVGASFPQASAKTANELRAEVQTLFPEDGMILSLDHVLANLDRSALQLQPVTLASEPPKILVSQRPAILVLIDGDPLDSPIDSDDAEALRFIVNTNWDLFLDPSDSSYYLLDEDGWLRASSLTSSWSPAGELPTGLHELPRDDNWKTVRENVPGRTLESGEVPIVYVSQTPAELILIEGEPDMGMVPETELLWVRNTESDLLYHQGDGHYYYLVSGRWFRARALSGGDWSFASEDLPEDFKRIEPSHPRGRVLSSVPGTPQAEEAVLLAQIPQKAAVSRDEVEEPAVLYQGEPEFELIEGTSIAHAINTGHDVLRVGELYYLCSDGVWFVSSSPEGPWKLAETLPETIQTIPPSSPVHHVTYVSVYGASPTHVTYGYTAGYVGVYYSWGSVVFGTGFYYHPYYYWGPYYPIYYPYPHTYGVAAYYNPYTGTYGRGARAYGPYGGVGRSAAYNPRTGTYARGASAWGPYQGRGFAEAYNPRTGTYAQTRQGSGPYSRWGTSAVRQGDDWARTARAATPTRGVAAYQTSSGESGAIVRNQGNVYAGKDGNVYRRSEGGWQQYDQGSWSQVDRKRERSTMNQLDRDFQGRAQGANRTQAYQSWRAGGRARPGRARRR